MSGETASATPRSTIRRVGLLLLHLLTPGSGLLRAGRVKLAFLFFAVPTTAAAAVLAVYRLLDELTFGVFAPLFIGLLAVLVFVYVGGLATTWRVSRFQPAARHWYSRWYAIVGLILLNAAAGEILIRGLQSQYRNFYAPAESMLPTLQVGDRFIVDVRQPVRLGRGDLAVYRSRGVEYVHRVVALGGDRVAVQSGRLIVNANPAELLLQGRIATDRGPADLYVETLRGQPARQVVDTVRNSYTDDYPEHAIATGTIFVMGDHRDNAADSRVPPEVGGAGLVPVDDVVGKVLFIYWSGDRSRIGADLG